MPKTGKAFARAVSYSSRKFRYILLEIMVTEQLLVRYTPGSACLIMEVTPPDTTGDTAYRRLPMSMLSRVTASSRQCARSGSS